MIPAFFAQRSYSIHETASHKSKIDTTGESASYIRSGSDATIHHDGDLVFVLGGEVAQCFDRRGTCIQLTPTMIGYDDSIKTQPDGFFCIFFAGYSLQHQFSFPLVSQNLYFIFIEPPIKCLVHEKSQMVHIHPTWDIRFQYFK